MSRRQRADWFPDGFMTPHGWFDPSARDWPEERTTLLRRKRRRRSALSGATLMFDRAKFCLLYVEGWDHVEGTMAPGNGRTVGTYDSLDDALSARQDYERAAPRLWGPGHLVITTGDGRPLLGPAVLMMQYGIEAVWEERYAPTKAAHTAVA